MINRNKLQSGQISLTILVFGAIAIILLSGFVIWADMSIKSVLRNTDQAVAFRVAEAGIEYYKWHLAHTPGDFQDGTGQPGPYRHDYFDKNGNKIGEFILDITPPAEGNTVVTVLSTGKVSIDPSIEKIIEAKFSKPTLSDYAVVTNSDIVFQPGAEVFGKIHSNGGIHFDGIAHNLVTSALDEYNDPDHSGNNEFGVHTHIVPTDPLPPASVPVRSDVFMAGRQFPVPAIDFRGISNDLFNIKTEAIADGRYFEPSDEQGYHIVFKTNDTFDIYKVTKVKSSPSGCIKVLGEKDWGPWTIESETLAGNYPIPQNGLIFIEDDVWVDGQINSAKAVVASGRFPENSAKYTSIVINKNLLYTNYDGRDVLGLISQGNINVGLDSEDNLRIDAALIAQNGRVGRQYYRPPQSNQTRCGPYDTRDHLTIYGMIASYDRYGFAYSDGTGYRTRTLIYDPNLRYQPPPGFPYNASIYQQISWTEIK
jgi:hypothetical protein